MPFSERYKTGNTPWEIHRADVNLVTMVRELAITPCKALDIGCGTGNNAIWLQEQGFEVVALDHTALAIERAQEKKQNSGSDCTFHLLDFLEDPVPGSPFGFAFDRGCFHHFTAPEQRMFFAEKLAMTLDKNGVWLTLAGNADETRQGQGPPQLSARQITSAVEPSFEILSLVAGHFDTDQEIAAKNWVCLMRKR